MSLMLNEEILGSYEVWKIMENIVNIFVCGGQNYIFVLNDEFVIV